jgi:hypothetical protein
MREAAERLAEGDQQGAQEAQRRAEEQLARAEQTLGQEERRRLERLKKAELEERAKKEREAAEQAREMAEQMRQSPTGGERSAGQSASQASESMQRAAEAMEGGEEEQAEAEQQQAVEELEQAEQQLAEEERAYRDLKAEQELLSIRAELEDGIAVQTDINKRTVQADNKRNESGSLSRRDRFALRKLAGEQRELAERLSVLVEKLREEQQTWVFAQRLEDAKVDMEEAAELLSDNPPSTGQLVQQFERDALRALLALREALEEEQGRRQQQQSQQGGEMPQQKRRLVPPLAELKMLKGMQEATLGQTRDLNEAIKLAGGEPNDFQREMLKRLAARQGNIADLLKKMSDDLMRQGGEGN